MSEKFFCCSDDIKCELCYELFEEEEISEIEVLEDYPMCITCLESKMFKIEKVIFEG